MSLADTQAACEAWLARAEQRPARWLTLFAVVLGLQIGPLWYASPDGAAYVSIARSIAAGGPVARLGNPQLGFPLGYPLLISPAFLTGPRPFLLLSIVHWVLAVIFMLGVHRWLRRRLGAGAVRGASTRRPPAAAAAAAGSGCRRGRATTRARRRRVAP